MKKITYGAVASILTLSSTAAAVINHSFISRAGYKNRPLNWTAQSLTTAKQSMQ
jgi:hypothetical protein